VVFEAAHGGWATSVQVIPAADTLPSLVAPFGTYRDWGQLNSRTGNWDTNGDGLLTDAEAQWDLAVIGMDSRIGDVTGWLGMASQASDSQATMVGYPTRGTGMMAEAVFADASSRFGVYDIKSVLGPGASGGPLLDATNHVIGVASSGDSTSSTYAGLFGTGTWDWLMGVMASNDVLIGDGLAITGTVANDQLLGDALNNTISGLAGNDVIQGGRGDDMIDGGSGLDLVQYSGTRSQYTVRVSGSSAVVADKISGRDGTDHLSNIERLSFQDMNLALDAGPGSSAGQAVLLLGAVLGEAALASKKPLLGSVIGLFDQGFSFQTLSWAVMGLDIWGILASDGASAPSATQIANYLLTTVNKVAPDAPTLANATKSILNDGQGVFLWHLAESVANQSQVHLVGLAATGVEYQ
jgi:hypothetical protein